MPDITFDPYPRRVPARHRHISAIDTDRSTTMHAASDLRLALAHAHRRSDLKAAATARLLRAQRAGRTTAFRVRLGRTVVRLGERLASEPLATSARPR
jgi:hypothetical protein